MSNKYAPPPPGLTNPTQQGMLAGTQRDSAIASNNQSNQKLNNLSSAVGGKRMKRRSNKRSKKRSKKRKGGAPANANSTSNQVIVPTVKTPYTPTGGPGQTPTDVQKQNAQTTTQSTANAVYDGYATQQGGKTKRTKRMKRRGGSSKWNWGCYSGGYSKDYSKKTKKHRKRRN